MTTNAPQSRLVDVFTGNIAASPSQYWDALQAADDHIASDAELRNLAEKADWWREQVEGKNCRIDELEAEVGSLKATIGSLQADLSTALDQRNTALQDRDSLKRKHERRGW